ITNDPRRKAREGNVKTTLSKSQERERERYRAKTSDPFHPHTPILFPLHNIKPLQKGPLKPATRSRPNLKRRWRVQEYADTGGPRPQATIIALGTHTCQYPKQRV
ncbi:hypothetical protein COCC4DRAFT_91540, partial [Bipolaris maydis ATCC 48331]